MNYRHIYHAGGLADLVKHITLTHLLKRLVEKPAAFCAIDTHAAIGLYNLTLEQARKTKEAEQGVIPFCRLPPHPALAEFQQILKTHNPALSFGPDSKAPQIYPGSPAIIRHYLREADRLIAVEKHAEDAAALERFMGHDARVNIHARDAWEAMQALISTPEKRLLVFIDPPFERPDEMDQAFANIQKAHAKATHGIFAFWYPIKDAVSVGKMQERFAASGIKKMLRADVIYKKELLPERMNGCGMLIVNPPWQLDVALRDAYTLLQPLFEAGAPAARIDWLT